MDEEPSWEAFTGQTREQYRGFGWVEMVHPDDREATLEVWNAALREQGIYEIEYRMKNREGQWRDVAVRGTPRRDESGRVSEWVGTSTDITQSKIAERALAQSKQQMQLVVDNAPMILFAIDKDGIFTLSRGKGLEALGFGQDEVVGRSLFEVYGAFPDIVADVRAALNGEISGNLATYDLGAVVFEGHLSPLKNPRGEVVGAIGVTTDVTAMRRAEAEHFGTGRAPTRCCSTRRARASTAWTWRAVAPSSTRRARR